MVASWISRKVRKGTNSRIHGLGLFAAKPIKKGEVIAIKGGHIVDWKTLKKHENLIGDSYLQIADKFVLAPLRKSEVKKVMMFLNHSCSPNVGLRGEITFVAMRNIKVGEELITDYAMIDDDFYEMKCNCGSNNCRGAITGKDWKRKDLQSKYGNYFSSYLLAKIKKHENRFIFVAAF
ncbi:MAG: SET domain-containing protein-lysine N-methyltransferase [Candidatus Aenigmarchaeota archaeon]|nr:SET domain-containing protein-lysine N-methyltransferase [Candidatus Aenigmarchaeota archaeon]